MTSYTDLKATSRRQRLRAAMTNELQRISGPVGTAEIVDAVANVLDVPEAHKPILARDVVAQADFFYPWARRSEATFKRFGRTMRRLVWSPMPASATPQMARGAAPRTIGGPARCLACDLPTNPGELAQHGGVCANCKFDV